MRTATLLTLLCLLTTFFHTKLRGQDLDKVTISGHIRDQSTGEELIHATVFVQSLGTGTTTNAYGFYSLTLPAGNYEFSYSYLGYTTKLVVLDLVQDVRQDVDLSLAQHVMDEVIVVGSDSKNNVQSTEMSTIDVDVETVKKIPALLGEVDIIKAIQLLPGVKSIGEGTSGFFVRGGNADQNLVLLDEAPIYNSSHLLGFFSSFNPDAIKDMQLYKGGMPAKYGGRLSSVLDIRMKEGNAKEFAGSAGIGSIMSRLSLEAPLGQNSSFIISGRRSYLDIIAKAAQGLTQDDNAEEDFTLYFYDLNAKVNTRINDNNRIFLSGYFGKDVIKESEEGLNVDWGNRTATFRWNHIFSPKLFSNFTVYYSNYDYGVKVDEFQDLDWQARLKEWSVKTDFSAYLSPSVSLGFGFQTIKHDINPGTVKVQDENAIVTFDVRDVSSLESAIYASGNWQISDQFSLEPGVRVSSLHNLGPATHYDTDENAEILDSTVYQKGSYHSSIYIEPRLAFRYQFKLDQAFKASYNRTVQYIQLASNGNTATPFDIWFTSSPKVQPQYSDHFALGYFRNFNRKKWELSLEGYYKTFTNAIDFREGANLLLNQNLEGELRFGEARAYGAEIMLRKDIGNLTGWINYTISKVEKKINSINNDQWYNAKYDKPHDLAVVLSYQWNKRISVSSNFVLSSGSAVTFPTGKYNYRGTIVPVYSDRNGERLPTYHRLDLSLTLQQKKNEIRKRKGEWVFSIYNAYNRKNAFAINFKQDEQNPNRTYAEKASIFSIVPSVTYNIKF